MKYQMANADGSRPSKCPECGQDLKHFDGDRCPACNALLEIIEPDRPSISQIKEWLDESEGTLEMLPEEDRVQVHWPTKQEHGVGQYPTGSWRTLQDTKEHGLIVIEFSRLDASAYLNCERGPFLVLFAQPTEKPKCFRLVPRHSESYEMQSDEYLGIRFELKSQGEAVLTYGNREHFLMVPNLFKNRLGSVRTLNPVSDVSVHEEPKSQSPEEHAAQGGHLAARVKIGDPKLAPMFATLYEKCDELESRALRQTQQLKDLKDLVDEMRCEIIARMAESDELSAEPSFVPSEPERHREELVSGQAHQSEKVSSVRLPKHRLTTLMINILELLGFMFLVWALMLRWWF